MGCWVKPQPIFFYSYKINNVLIFLSIFFFKTIQKSQLILQIGLLITKTNVSKPFLINSFNNLKTKKMRKLFVVFFAVAVAASFTSCKEQCEKDNTGEITVENKTERALWFDVRSGSSTNEIKKIEAGSSATYTMTPATLKVVASLDNEEFIEIGTKTLAQCGKETFTTGTQACSIFEVTDVTVNNNTGYSGTIDVYVYGGVGYLGEVYLSNGQSHTYTDVPIGSGSIDFEITIAGTWFWSNIYSFSACTPFTFTWNAKKLDESSASSVRRIIEDTNR